jgi:hypothetical protein
MLVGKVDLGSIVSSAVGTISLAKYSSICMFGKNFLGFLGAAAADFFADHVLKNKLVAHGFIVF